MRRDRVRAAVAAAGLAVFAAGGALAQERGDWPASFKVGTASQGGTYFIYGAGWAGLVSEMLGVPSSTEATGGPVQNFALTQAGDLQFAMTTMGPAAEAWNGESPLAPSVEMRDVRATFPMYQTPFQVIALASTGIESIADLDGKRVGVGPKGGTCGTYWPRYLEALGVDAEVQFGGASDLAGQVKDGLIDAFAFCAGLPIAAFSELEAQSEVLIFAFTEEEQATLVESFPVSAYEIPGGVYQSTPDPQRSVAMWNFGIAHKDMPESFVYEIMKVVLDSPERMQQIHGAAKETLAENYLHNGFLDFHPGAVRYLREKGLELDDEVLPPELGG